MLWAIELNYFDHVRLVRMTTYKKIFRNEQYLRSIFTNDVFGPIIILVQIVFLNEADQKVGQRLVFYDNSGILNYAFGDAFVRRNFRVLVPRLLAFP